MNALVRTTLRQRVLVLVMFLASLVGGAYLFSRLNIEAYPDPTPPMVVVLTQVQGLSAEEVERYVTIPVEVQMAGMPNLKAVRSTSLFGLSQVSLQFTFDYNYEQALQQVLNRLAQLPPLASGAQPQISPTSPIGEIIRYRLVGPPGYSLTDLKTLQDWVLQRRLRSVPGVIDVTGWGGKTKTYEVSVDFDKLVAYRLTFGQVLQALANANLNVGGNTIDIGPQSAVVRGVGQIRSLEDIADTMLSQSGGSPVLVKDIATVQVGYVPRLGIAGHERDDDIVEGIVLMRRGEKSMPTILRVRDEIERINASDVLPPGVRIEYVYDRKDLIDVTTHTVIKNMVEGVLLIFVLQFLFLGNLRSAIIVSATIPFALFFAIALLLARGESANLLSVGAIDFGLVVDATVIMVERIYLGLAEGSHGHGEVGRKMSDKLAVIGDAAAAVGRSILFASAIIIAGFVPLFTLSGVEGHIFGPMAKTYAYAIAGGLIATFLVSPALCALLLPAKLEEKDTFVVRTIRAGYMPALLGSIRARRITIAMAGACLLLTAAMAGRLGMEFLPKLEEGNLWIRATFPSTISLEEANPYVNRMRNLIASFSDVKTVVSQHGRPDDGTDASGFFNAEFFTPLRSVERKDELTQELLAKLQREFPGVEFNFSQYLQDNVAEAVSGIKGENSIKLYANDLKQLTETAEKIRAVLAKVPGVTDLAVFAALGQPTVQIDIDRSKAARYGLSPGDINSTIKTAIGGEPAGDLYEPGSDRHFPIIVRLGAKWRKGIENIRELTIAAQSPSGIVQIPLRDVATVRLLSGASYIYREGQQRYLPIKFSVRGRDLGSTIQEAQQKIAEQVQLPPGSRMELVGEFGNLKDAVARLSVVVPMTILLIALLLYFNFGSLIDTLLALSVIPMAIVGGVAALYLTDTAFSISAAIGFIALFGIATMDGIIVLNSFNRMVEDGIERTEAIVSTCREQMRPVVMTCIVACVGLVPAAMSSGIGSQVQKPLALVVVGGMLLAPVLILLILPVLILTFSQRHSRHAATDAAGAPHSASAG